MNLETSLMGIPLKNPFVVGSSSLTNSIKNIKKCEEAGAGAVVLKSLYEEQILMNSQEVVEKDDMYQWYPEAMEFVNTLSLEHGLDQYLELIAASKSYVDIPVIASVNCYSSASWVSFVKKIEDAGADGIELNIGVFPENEHQSSGELEKTYLEIVTEVEKATKLPVAVKMGTYFTNIRAISHSLARAGAGALVFFNRFYRPDIDIEAVQLTSRDTLSGPEELTTSLRWVGLLSHKLPCDVIAATGIHSAEGAIKQLLAGAAAVQVCSVLYTKGIDFVRQLVTDFEAWMNRKGYRHLSDFRGLINHDPQNSLGWERINFMKRTTGHIIRPILP
jgi:dihydroorotate dehydrogenase (fumarate)